MDIQHRFYQLQHVGWWSPTIIRGEDREAVHIPNHQFTINVVRNLSQKTHWRIKTHLAISHLDVNKINVSVILFISFQLGKGALFYFEYLYVYMCIYRHMYDKCMFISLQNIVADMRKVLAKNPQVEQQRLHRRVFLENVNPENQALLVGIKHFDINMIFYS